MVAQFVKDIVMNLLFEHYHDFLYKLMVTVKSSNQMRVNAAKEIVEQFHAKFSHIYDEIDLIRKTLNRVAVTWSEKSDEMFFYCQKFLNEDNINGLFRLLGVFFEMISNPQGEMQENFKLKYSEQFF